MTLPPLDPYPCPLHLLACTANSGVEHPRTRLDPGRSHGLGPFLGLVLGPHPWPCRPQPLALDPRPIPLPACHPALQTLDYSTQVFSLGVLLSSLLVYNQMGGIDESSIDK